MTSFRYTAEGIPLQIMPIKSNKNYSLSFNSLAITLRTTKFNIKKILHGARIAFICFVRISQKTATFALHNISRFVLYNRGTERLLRVTHWVLNIKLTPLVFKGLIIAA
jgi:hypothetical protein